MGAVGSGCTLRTRRRRQISLLLSPPRKGTAGRGHYSYTVQASRAKGKDRRQENWQRKRERLGGEETPGLSRTKAVHCHAAYCRKALNATLLLSLALTLPARAAAAVKLPWGSHHPLRARRSTKTVWRDEYPNVPSSTISNGSPPNEGHVLPSPSTPIPIGPDSQDPTTTRLVDS